MFQIDLHWPISKGVTDFKIAAPSLWEKKKEKKRQTKPKNKQIIIMKKNNNKKQNTNKHTAYVEWKGNLIVISIRL